MDESNGKDRKIVATLSDVVKRFGSTLALDHVDFDIRAGEILGLLGPNGAGKTTAIRALAGLIGVDSGAIEVFGTAQRPDPDFSRFVQGEITRWAKVVKFSGAKPE